VRAGLIAGERLALGKPGARIQRPGWAETVHRTCFQAQQPVAALSRNADEVVEHGPAKAEPTSSGGRVHRLELALVITEVFQRSDRQQFATAPAAIKRHSRVEQAIGIEREHAFQRALRSCEVQMAGDEFADIGRKRVINANDVVSHRTNLGNRGARPGGPMANVTPAKQSVVSGSRTTTVRRDLRAARLDEGQRRRGQGSGEGATVDSTGSALAQRLRAALTAALGSGDRTAATAVRSALAAVGNAEAVHPAAADGQAEVATNPSEHFAGARAGLGAGEAPRKRLSAAEVMQIVLAEIAERQCAAVEYDRLGHCRQAERLRREADVLAAVLGPECGDAQPAR